MTKVDRQLSSKEVLEKRVGHALRYLGDRTILNRSPLSRIAFIERLAMEEYSGRLLPRGAALNDLLNSAIEQVLQEIGGEPRLDKTCTYLRLLMHGLSGTQISKELQLSREHVCRHYRRIAIQLVTDVFLSRIKGSEQKLIN